MGCIVIHQENVIRLAFLFDTNKTQTWYSKYIPIQSLYGKENWSAAKKVHFIRFTKNYP